jgi:hypothetical protein
MIPITWSFAVWGLDLLGPFKKTPGGLAQLLVAVDKFTKWVEVKPMAKIGSMLAVDFSEDIIFFASGSLNYHYRQWHSVHRGKIPRLL